MDYAQRYKDALRRAKKLYGQGTITECLGWIFPEIKESKDEKNIKDLIDELKCSLRAANCQNDACGGGHEKRIALLEWGIAWLEKQGNKIVDCQQNHQDVKYPNGGIVMEDFNGGEGFYKLHLDYLSKKQVKEVEEMVRTWNKEPKTSNENIKNCVEMCLTDANEQRFEDFGTTLKDCLAWLEKQGEQHPHVDVNKMVDIFAHTEVKGYGVPSMIEVDAYRRGIEAALKYCLTYMI